MVVVLILSLLVILHELGHFFVAIWQKIKVDEFGLGFPPKAVKLFSWRGTDFSLNWVPFGGFVRLHGEFVSSQSNLDQQAFYQKSAGQQILVMLGGPGVNLMIAIIIFSIAFSIGGIPVSLQHQPRIGQIVTGSPAALAGLSPQTNLIGFKSINPDANIRVELQSIEAVQKFVQEHRGETWLAISALDCQNLICSSQIKETPLYIRTAQETPANQGAMGIIFAEYVVKFYPWYEMPFRGVWYGLIQTLDLTKLMLSELGKLVTQLITGQGVSQAVAGPIGIVHQAEKAGLNQAGWLVIANFAGMLSLNLAVMNLLPIPALDGGRIVMVFLGYIFGKLKIEKFENYFNYGGFIFLLGVLVLISFRDIWNIWLQK